MLFIIGGVAEAAPQSSPPTLSLAEAIALARQNNPDFQVRRNELRSANWGTRAAFASLLPTVGFSSQFGYTAGGERRYEDVVITERPAQLSSSYSLGVSLTLSGSTLLAPAEAKATARAAEQNVREAGATLESEVTQHYLSVLEAQEALAQAKRELDRTSAHVELARARFDAGLGTQLDIRRAEVLRGQAEYRVLETSSLLAREVLLLGQMTGVSLPEDVVLPEGFQLFAPMWEAEELVELARSSNPSLLASQARSSAASVRARAALTQYLPRISFSTGLSGFVSQVSNISPLVAEGIRDAQLSFERCVEQNQRYSSIGWPTSTCIDPAVPGFEEGLRERLLQQNRGFPFGYDRLPIGASISISIPVFTGLSRQRQVEEARIGRQNARYEVRAAELQLEVGVKSTLRALQTAYDGSRLQAQNRELAADELLLAQERFDLGVGTSVEVADAQARLGEAERAEITSIYNFHRTLAALQALVGGPLPR